MNNKNALLYCDTVFSIQYENIKRHRKAIYQKQIRLAEIILCF